MKRFDKARQGKKVSNTDWESPADPDSRITKMKDGTTHLAYKAEQTVDLKTDMILSAEIYHADRGDAKTIEDTVQIAQANLLESGSTVCIRDVVADKGYHSAETITTFAEENLVSHLHPRAATASWPDTHLDRQATGTTRRGLCQPSTDSRPTW